MAIAALKDAWNYVKPNYASDAIHTIVAVASIVGALLALLVYRNKISFGADAGSLSASATGALVGLFLLSAVVAIHERRKPPKAVPPTPLPHTNDTDGLKEQLIRVWNYVKPKNLKEALATISAIASVVMALLILLVHYQKMAPGLFSVMNKTTTFFFVFLLTLAFMLNAAARWGKTVVQEPDTNLVPAAAHYTERPLGQA